MKNHKTSGTCIVALKNSRGKILVAADRRASWSFSKAVTMNKAKVRKRDGIIIAGTGSGALCSLFVDAFTPPEYNGEDLDIFMHFVFHRAIKKILTNHDYADEHKVLKIPSDSGCELIIGIAGHVYTVDIFNPEEEHTHINGLINIDEVPTPYTTGCGGEHAKGAIDACMHHGIKDTRLIATTAIKVAANNSPGCDDKIDIVVED